MKEINRREFLEMVIPTLVGVAATAVPIVKALADRENLSVEKKIERVESEVKKTPSESLRIENIVESNNNELAPVYGEEVMKWKVDIHRWAKEYGIDVDLIASILRHESNADPNAEAFPDEDRGGKGFFQVTPDKFAERENWRDPDTNARRGLGYLSGLLKESDGQIKAAVAGYNGGSLAMQWYRGDISRQDYVDFINEKSSYSYLDGEEKAQQVETYIERVVETFNVAKEWGILQLPYMNDQREAIANLSGTIYPAASWEISNPPKGLVIHQIGDKPGSEEKPFDPDKFDGVIFIKARGWNQPAYNFLIGTKTREDGFAECYYMQDITLGTYHVPKENSKRYTHLSASFVDYEYDGSPPTQPQLNTITNLAIHLSMNLRIPVSEVIGHREDDPANKADPVGVDMDLFRNNLSSAITNASQK